MIDDDTLKQLLRINDELMQLCKFLNEKRDIETSSRLIPLVDDLTRILIEAGKNKIALMQPYKGYLIESRTSCLHTRQYGRKRREVMHTDIDYL
jgi:hypothetical protein